MYSSPLNDSSTGTTERPLRVALLVGSDNQNTRDSIHAVCVLPQIKVAAVLLDTAVVRFSRRFKNLGRNIRADGWKYIGRRALGFARDLTEHWASSAAVSQDEVQALLHRAFPERCFSMKRLADRYGFAFYSAGNLNGPAAIKLLSESDADLGIVLGTRILKPTTFSIPHFGCINLHKGKVPEYRGMPPGFWEIFDRATTAGVTVHFVDKGLDTGDVLETREVSILATDTPDSLLEKLHVEGNLALCEAISKLQKGTSVRHKQSGINKPRSKPTYNEVRELRNRLPHWRRRSDGYQILKNLYALVLYYSGVYAIIRTLHRLSFSRGAIFLYHRVNNYSRDPLTVDTAAFASQLLALSKRYTPMNSAELVRRIRGKLVVPPTSVTIHFDDCYQDIFTNGAPLLSAVGFPATAFINSGFIDTLRVYPHDSQKYPFLLPNLTRSDVRAWVRLGFEVGNHTVNHVDLGVHPIEEAKREIEDCEKYLREITGGPIKLFSFPFGDIKNIRQEVVDCIRSSGYLALFAAHGGFITSKTDPYDIPRLGANGDLNPLVMLLEVEGLAPNQFATYFRQTGARVRRLLTASLALKKPTTG
jgi:peptidoglycan/xylan/chitin deacetylase (PgdA/CDA1 family)